MLRRFEKFSPVLLGALYGLLVFALLLCPSCKKPAAPAPSTQPASKVMAAVIPGFQVPQTDDIAESLAANHPQLNVVNFGTGKNGYLSDVAGYIEKNPHSDVILIGHSYGGDKACQTAKRLDAVKLMILVDPIQEVGTPALEIPSSVEKCVVIWADFSGLFRPTIRGAFESHHVREDHNQICHVQETYDLINSAVQGVSP